MSTDSPLIGYGAFHLESGCYEEYDLGTMVADSPESLRALLRRAEFEPGDYRTDELRLSDILAGRGEMVGMLCLEPQARWRFVAAADAAGFEYELKVLEDRLVSVQIPSSAMNDITDIPAIKPVLDYLYDEEPPEAEIAALAEAVRADPELAERTLALFSAEVERDRKAHGALLVWLGYALVLAGDSRAFDRFMELFRAHDRNGPGVELFREHAQVALGCLLFYDESARRVAERFPFPESGLEKLYGIWDDLALLASVCRSRDEELRRRVAAEAERLLGHPRLDGGYVELVCDALAAADPKRALDVIPNHQGRCEDEEGVRKLLRVIRKRGSAEHVLVADWQSLAADAAGQLLAHLDAYGLGEGSDEAESDDEGYEDFDEGLPRPPRLLVGDEEGFDGFEPRVEPQKPEPEPDPYAPCPCGSGKKYKWCCREKDRKARE